jgi:hypothetical protein
LVLLQDWNGFRRILSTIGAGGELTFGRVAPSFSEIPGYGFFGEALRSGFGPHPPDLHSVATLVRSPLFEYLTILGEFYLDINHNIEVQ